MIEEASISRRLEIRGWRQFGEVDIEFHPSLTVLTGANGAGKTTLLNFLSRHFGWSIQLVGTPRRDRSGQMRYFTGLKNQDRTTIGRITYSDGQVGELQVPAEAGQAFQVGVTNQPTVSGIFIPSHRVAAFYQPVTEIPAQLSARQQVLQMYINELISRYSGSHTGRSPSYRLKEALISLATFGYGNQVVQKNQEAIETFEGFQRILATVLPKELGFKSIQIRMPEVVLETASGDFSFDAVSGGLSSLMDLAWQIHMASLVYDSFVVVLDEPENHLHPSLQRTVLPSLLEAFPQAQFITASHNPFIVGSVPDSNVYVLQFVEASFVKSHLLDTLNKAGSSNEILRDALGLDFTMPVWVEDRLDGIVARYSDQPLTRDSLIELREEMSSLGMDYLFPEAVDRVLPKSINDQTH